MEIIKIICLSLGSITVLFLLTKAVGQREMSGLSVFDFTIAITIGSIAAEMATSLENNFVQHLAKTEKNLLQNTCKELYYILHS